MTVCNFGVFCIFSSKSYIVFLQYCIFIKSGEDNNVSSDLISNLSTIILLAVSSKIFEVSIPRISLHSNNKLLSFLYFDMSDCEEFTLLFSSVFKSN